MLSWPAGVPYASTYNGFGVEQTANPVLRTEMNAGTSRQRRTSTIRISTVKHAIEMHPDQVAAFDAFHAALGDGAARFAMPIWDGAGWPLKTVQIMAGKVSKTQLGVDVQLVAFTTLVQP